MEEIDVLKINDDDDEDDDLVLHQMWIRNKFCLKTSTAIISLNTKSFGSCSPWILVYQNVVLIIWETYITTLSIDDVADGCLLEDGLHWKHGLNDPMFVWTEEAISAMVLKKKHCTSVEFGGVWEWTIEHWTLLEFQTCLKNVWCSIAILQSRLASGTVSTWYTSDVSFASFWKTQQTNIWE